MFNLLGVVGLLAAFCLSIVLLYKIGELRRLRLSLSRLQKSFDELDEQAKLIVRTDLELNKAQEELDKKVSGLYTLQRLSQAISTTLDENRIFERIEESLIMELGFEKAMAFSFCADNSADAAPRLNIKMQAGYSDEEVEKVKARLKEEDLLPLIMRNKGRFSAKHSQAKEAGFLDRTIKDICGLNAFVDAQIITKDGPYGLIIMGNESSFSSLTEGDEEMVSILASQLGQAIDNSRLFEQTFRSHQELERRVAQRTKELSDALEKIKKISKRKSEFVSAVSHELRTPLTSIKGYASILAAGKLGELPLAAKERMEKINRHSNELAQLINNLLDVSRIESGRVEMKTGAVSLRDLVRRALDVLMPQIKQKGQDVSWGVGGDVPCVSADAGQIERVFINLIGNAIKYTPEKGRISIAVRPLNDKEVKVDISDTGCGIAGDDLHKVFEEFYRTESATTRGVKGTGLGLSLVKYIIEAHKGRIWATGALGKGSTFSFTLPLIKDA
ncbi:MAG: ATP-binding protein [Candidatus Omnitrophota bacterium]